MNRLPDIIDLLPEGVDILNCSVCFDNGLTDKNQFKIFADKKYRYFVCTKCESISRFAKIVVSSEVLK